MESTYVLQYDVAKDFEPIVLLADAPLLLVAKKTIPANDLKEFIAWLRANPDRFSMATVGAGSPGVLLGFLLRKETGARFGRADRCDVQQHGDCIEEIGRISVMNEHVPATATGRWVRRPSLGHAPPVSGEAVGFTPAAPNRGREANIKS